MTRNASLCNSIALRMDRRLAGAAVSMGFSYTRYADELTCSGDDPSRAGEVLRVARLIVAAEGV